MYKTNTLYNFKELEIVDIKIDSQDYSGYYIDKLNYQVSETTHFVIKQKIQDNKKYLEFTIKIANDSDWSLLELTIIVDKILVQDISYSEDNFVIPNEKSINKDDAVSILEKYKIIINNDNNIIHPNFKFYIETQDFPSFIMINDTDSTLV